MRKKVCTLLTAFTLTLASSITAFAAPEVMPDGGVFDAEYYAQNNPDVVAAFGTDKELLYSHYVNNGRAEGRLAVAPEAQNVPTQDAQAEANIALMEEVYSKVINISMDNMEEFYTYMLANLDTIRNACAFVEVKDCPTLYDGIPLYTVYYYTYVAKDGQRLNMIVDVEDRHIYGKEPAITLEFLVCQEIIDSSKSNIKINSCISSDYTKKKPVHIYKYEHCIVLNSVTESRGDKNIIMNNGRYCYFRTLTTLEGNRTFTIWSKGDQYLAPDIKANEYVEYRVVANANVANNRITLTR